MTCSPYSTLAKNGITLTGKTETDGWGDTVYAKEITVDETFPAYVTADNGKAAMDSYKTLIDDKIEDMRKDIKDHYAPYPADFDGKVTSIESFDYVDTYVAFTNKKNYDTNEIFNLYKITVKTDKEKKAVTFYASISCSNIVATGETFTEEPYFSTAYYNKEEDFKKKVVEAEGYTTTKAGEAAKPATDDSSAAASEATTTTTTTTTAKTDSSAAETTTTAKDKAATTTTTTLVP